MTVDPYMRGRMIDRASYRSVPKWLDSLFDTNSLPWVALIDTVRIKALQLIRYLTLRRRQSFQVDHARLTQFAEPLHKLLAKLVVLDANWVIGGSAGVPGDLRWKQVSAKTVGRRMKRWLNTVVAAARSR
jgi:hypothetical protein